MKIYKFSLFLVLSFWALNDTFAQDNSNLDMNIDKIENQSNINTKNLEFSPSFFGNSLIYVSSETSNKKFDYKIGESFFTLKEGVLDSLGNIVNSYSFLDELNIPNHLGPCAFGRDGELLFLSRNKKVDIKSKGQENDINPMGIYLYKYSDSTWQKAGDFPFNNANYKVFHPTWDDENNRLIFASDMPGGYGGTDLYSVEYIDGKWSGLKNLGSNINSIYNEAFPFIYNSKYLFFASNKQGGKGGFDIYFSVENNGFTDAKNLGSEINSESDDFGLIIDENALVGYFNSNRPGGKGKDDIYKISFTKPIIRDRERDYFTINVKNSTNGSAIEKAEIIFYKYKVTTNKNPEIKKIKGIDKQIIYTIDPNSLEASSTVYSGKNGTKKVNLPNGSYIIKVKKSGYAEYKQLVNTSISDKDINVSLIPDVYDYFEITFIDEENNSAGNITLYEKNGKTISVEGQNPYVLKVLRGETLNIVAAKEGYKDKIIDISYPNTPAKFDAVMHKKIKYVEHLPVDKGEILVLRDIIYDYNSDILTNKAKMELDKLASHLKKHKDLVIELGSHTDSRGSDSYNLKLSKKRSASAKRYIVKNGVKADRIKEKGYGETMIKNHCTNGVKCSEEEHSLNRRTEVKVL